MNKNLPKLCFLAGFASVFFIARTNQGGPGAGYTNAPSESNCATSGCHTSGGGLVTSGTNWNRIALRDQFTGGGYIPDSTYEFVLTHKETGMLASGFQITCLNASNVKAGTFATADGRTQSYTASNRSYLGHSSTGSSVVGTDSTAYRIKWTAPTTNMGNLTFYVTLNKANGNGQNSGDVIYAKTFTASPSSLLPSADVKILDSKYCAGQALTFEATTTGNPTSYDWKFPGIGVSPSTSKQASPKVTYSSSGTYRAILTVTNSKGVSLPDTLTFTVLASPSANITPNTTQSICDGDSVQLAGNIITNATYLWSPGGETSRIIYAKDSGNYTVQVTGVNGCFRTSAPVRVNVNPLPELTIIKSFSGDTICDGSPFSVGAFVLSGSVDSFSFSARSGPYQDSTTYKTVMSGSSATYQVWGKNALGCISKPASLTVFGKQPEAAPVLSSSDIDYTGFRVNWQPVTNATAYFVSTDSGKTFITPSSGSTGLYHDVTGLLGNHTMKVLVYAAVQGICDKTQTADITVTTLSCSPIDFTVTTADDRVCKNSDATVVLNKLAGKNIAVRVDGTYVGSDTIQNITVTGTRNYQVSVLDSNALICGYTNQNIMLVEDTIGLPILSAIGNVNICSNNSTAPFTLWVTPGTGTDSIDFYQNGTRVSSDILPTFDYTVADGDVLSVFARNASGCTSDSGNTVHITITPIPSAAFNISNVQFQYDFAATDTMGTHKWRIGSDSTTGKTAQFDLTSYKNDTAIVEHTIVKNGCSATSVQKLFVPDFASVRTSWLKGTKVYPNPAGDLLFVSLPEKSGNGSFEIRNASGQLVLSAQLSEGNNTVYTDVLVPGSYVFKIRASQKETTGSLIIVR